MSNDRDTALHCLGHINPSVLEYDEWLAVGMACKDAGVSVADWEQWSQRDSKRYRKGECERKWRGFQGATRPVGLGTLVKFCTDHGGPAPAGHRDEDPGHELAWDAVIGPREEERPMLQVVRPEWLQDAQLPPAPDNWDGRADLRRYLEVLFQAEERVGLVVEAWEGEEGRWLPRKGVWDRTAGELTAELVRASDLGAVVGDWKEDVGAWVRFNPLDGAGCRDENVTAYRHALVECDDMPIDRQYALYQQLELPIAALVHSGGKSLHAIVRVDAPDYKEYQKRVDFLYDVCKRNGLVIDRKNRNPSRLSRLPGATRNGNPQRLVATNIGKATWAEWADWIAAVNDDLPDVETLATYLGNLPPLADGLIDGVLRCGHKMLLSGPSKAGKSFMLLQLCVALAEGRQWLGWQCRRGRVLYVNLELDRASCYHRLAGVYQALQLEPEHAEDIDVWNLRGKAMAMDQLAPRLIRRAMKRRYSAVVIDPIYKVITGDENAADQMAKFCNQFDRVCAELGAAVIYCHHHSKGDQGQKRAHDRASGSGVFARDPDALLDMIELTIDDHRRKQISSRWQCEAMAAALDSQRPDWRDECGQDDAVVADRLAEYMVQAVGVEETAKARVPAIQAAETASGWRVEGILREFPTFKPRRCFFRYPTHADDIHGLLQDATAEGEELIRTPKEAGAAKTQKVIDETRNAVDACREDNGIVKVEAVIEYLGLDKTAVYKRLKKAGFCTKNGLVETDTENE